MRRRDRELTTVDQALGVLKRCKVLRLGLVEDGLAYVVPMNFGFQLEEGGALRLYLHSAQQGRKLDLLRRAEKVSFEMDGGHRLLEGRGACDFSYAYACLMGQARPVFLEDREEKRRGLACILRCQSGGEDLEIPAAAAEKTLVLRLDVLCWTAKENPPPAKERRPG